MKKITSVVLVFIMALVQAGIVPVYAATAATVFSWDFSSAELPNTNCKLVENNAVVSTIAYSTGVYGKDESDACVGVGAYAKNSYFDFAQVGGKSILYTADGYGAGSVVLCSVDFAFENEGKVPILQITGTRNTGSNITNLYADAANLNVALSNVPELDAKKWHNLQVAIKINSADRTVASDVKIWIDNTQVGSGTVMPNNTIGHMFTMLRLTNPSKDGKNTMYLDNAKADIYRPGTSPQFDEQGDDNNDDGVIKFDSPYELVTSNKATFAYQSGIYGKEADDTVLQVTGTSGSGSLLQIQDITNLVSVGVGKKVEFSFDVALSDIIGANDFFITLMLSPSNGATNSFRDSDNTVQNYGLNFTDGNVEFYGKTSNHTMDSKKWHNCKIVYDITAARNVKATLYIDGEKVRAEVLSTPYDINKVRYARFTTITGNTAYLDNIDIVIGESEKVYEEAVSEDFNSSVMQNEFKALNCTPEYVGGAFGKGSDDISLKINEGYLDFAPAHDIHANDTVEYSFEFATDNIGHGAVEKKFGPMNIYNGIAVQNGRMIFFDLDKGVTIEEKKWYRVTLEMKISDDGGIADITAYVNGQAISLGEIALAAAGNSIGGLRFEPVDGDNLYIDNIYFNVSQDGGLATALEIPNIDALDIQGAKIIDNEDKVIDITGQPELTVGDFVSHADNAVILRYDGTGAQDSDLLAGCRVYSLGQGIYYTKYSIRNRAENYYDLDSFDGREDIIKNLNTEYSTVSTQTSEEYGNSLAIIGKSSDSNVITASKSYLPMAEFNFVHSGANVFTIEYMMKVTGNNADYSLQLRDSETKSSYLPVTFNADGGISTHDEALQTEGNWQKDRWIGVTVTAYPKAHLYDLYIDGEFIGCGTGSNLSDLNQVRIIQNYSQGKEVSDVLQIDNVRIYAGVPELYGIEYYKDGEKTDSIDNADAVCVEVNKQRQAVAVLSQYDDNNRLLSIAVGKNVRLDNIKDANSLKLFLWNDLSKMQPLDGVKVLKPQKDMVMAADAKVSGAIGDDMVIQRNEPISVWGTTESPDGTYVEVSLDGKRAYGVASGGKWEAILPAMEADNEAKTLTVTTMSGTEEFSNILIGDVYMVGGQSNAFLQMYRTSDYEEYLAKASENDNIRFFYQRAGSNMTSYYADTAFSDTKRDNPYPTNYWQVADENTLSDVSALGYYTATTLREEGVDVPIGIISVAHNGTAMNQLIPSEVAEENGILGAKSYNALAAPFEKSRLCALLWYHGESDSSSTVTTDRYEKLLSEYIDYARSVRNQPDIKVYSVQLSSHGPTGITNANVPMMRSVQFDYSKNIDGLYLIPSLDKGTRLGDSDESHPPYKRELGKRIAGLLQATVYGKKELSEVSAPVPKSFAYDDTGVTITFDCVADTLMLSNGTKPVGFELTKDGVAYQASATLIDSNTIRIECSAITKPDGVRYAFYKSAPPSLANIVNSNGLPCPAFVDANKASGTTNADIRKIPALSEGVVEP
ncbi:MAG: hypothetical protein IJT23_08335 [Clostridia bacterium]|nr:hypothetical protein [Clostridia bacterium]